MKGTGGRTERSGRIYGRRAGAVIGVVIAALVAGAVSGSGRSSEQEAEFPHGEHAGLFPLCTGCHEGVPAGDRSRFYPRPEVCANCHDGEEREEVDWQPGERPLSNLRFEHPEHDEEARSEGTTLGCSDCHTTEGATRMEVAGVLPQRCLSCHEHEARDHYVDARCSTCHRPLAESGFGLARIEALPMPRSHRTGSFLETGHGEAAGASTETCATCHTRERCTSCHVDAPGVDAIAALPSAPSDMSLPAFEAEYPTPASHEDTDWLESHGRYAGGAECSTCHTRQSCTTCHRESRPEPVAELADRADVMAPGVTTRRRAPRSHRSAFFGTEHGTVASADGASCSSCHAETTCTECHTSESRAPSTASVGPGDGNEFHPPDFLARHASAAYGARLECSTCHNTAVFCRDCHEQLGMGPEGRLGPGFHDGQAAWIFRHGQAARQSLEGCASCHEQRDCLECHSTVGRFQVNPHGPDFDAEGYAERNREICFACHLQDPLGGRNP